MSDTTISPAVGGATATGNALAALLFGRILVPAAGALAGAGNNTALDSATSSIPSIPAGSLALSGVGGSSIVNAALSPSVGGLTLTGISAAGDDTTTSNTARLYITEFESFDQDIRSGSMFARCPPLFYQGMGYQGTSSTLSAPFSSRTRVIRVHTDTLCSILIGPAPLTAVALGGMRMQANTTEYFAVRPGDCLAVIITS